MRRPNLIHAIQAHEGTGHTEERDGKRYFFPYDDSDEDLRDVVGDEGDLEGSVTIGFGRNLTATGITEQEATMLLKNDLERIENALRSDFEFWPLLEQPRQNVLIEMAYHMGVGGLFTFESMLSALQDREFEAAAYEISESSYGDNFPERSDDLANRMREGVPFSNGD